MVTTTANGEADLPASTHAGDQYDGVRVQYVQTAFPRRFFGARVREPLTAALERADVCHIHGVWNVPEWWASYLARSRRRPYVVSPRGMLQPQAVRRGRLRKSVAYQLLERANLRGAALLHATSEQEADALRDLQLGVPIAVVPNGVDLESAQSVARGYRERLGIPPDAFVVLYLGRMHRIKRLDLLADAFDDLRRTHPSAHLVLAGHDEQGLVPGLMRRLSAHESSVHPIAAVGGRDKWALLRDADAIVVCSDSESFGMTVVESLAAGVPAVVTRTCPWCEIEQRQCGLWVEQHAAAIANALRRLRGRSGGTAPDGGACGRVRSGTIRLGRDRAGDVAPLRRAALIVSVIVLTPNLSGADGISTVARLVTGACEDVTVLALHEADRTTFDEVDVEGSGGRSSHFVTAATRWAVVGRSAGDRHRQPPASRAGGAGVRGARRLAVDDRARRRGVEAADLAAAGRARPQRADCRRLGLFARSVSSGQSATSRSGASTSATSASSRS